MEEGDDRRTDRYEKGVIQKEIIKYVLNFEYGIKEPQIRNYLEEKFGLTAQKGIKIHLEKILLSGILDKKETRGGPNLWSVNYENSSQVSEFIATNLLIPHFFSYEARDEILGVFNSPGTQRILKDFNYFELFYFTFFYQVIGIWKGISYISSIEVRDNIEFFSDNFKKYIENALRFSPSLFCSLFGATDIIKLTFWLTFDDINLLTIDRSKLIEFLSFHYITTALMIDFDHFDMGAKVMHFLHSNQELVNYTYIKPALDKLSEAEKLEKNTRKLVETLLNPPSDS